MIEIYPSKLEGAPIEQYPLTEAITIEGWLRANVKGFTPQENPPISVEVNGKLIDAGLWQHTVIRPGLSQVRIFVEPKAIGAAGAIAAAIAAAAAAVVATVILTRPRLPSANTQDNGTGKQLGLATVKGNQAKLNSVIREVAGRRKVYPDYLVPPRRYFKNKREQWVEVFLCIGKGQFSIPPGTVQIGETPIVSFGEDASYRIYGPGAYLLEETAADWWFSSAEVGGTSTGTAGLELDATYTVDQQPASDTITAAGYTLSIPVGAGYFPVGWAPGLLARVEIGYPYTVTDGTGPGGRDVITGPLSQVGLFPGMLIEIAGDNAGVYKVNTYSSSVGLTLNYPDGGAVTGLQVGDVTMSIAYKGMRYRVTAVSGDASEDNDDPTQDHGPSTITVVRLTDTNDEDDDWPGFDARTTNIATVRLDDSTLEGAWTGPFVACPENEQTATLEWDVMFPAGLVELDKKGRPNGYSVTVEFQYRDILAAGAWSSVIKTYSDATLDQLGFTERLQLPSKMRPEVRMRRIGADSTNTSIQDTVQWYGLRASIEGRPVQYEGVTTMAVKVRGGGRLAAQAENQVSAIVTRILEGRETREIAPWVRYVAQSVGYPLSYLDLNELNRLNAIWAAREDYYDQAVEDPTTVKANLAEALQAGYAELTMDRGKIRPVRDERKTSFVSMFTPQNFTDDLKRQFTAITADEFDGVDVEYVDGRTWQKETVECRLPGDMGYRVQKITVEGVTSRARAWRIGMRQRRTQRYRRWTYQWGTEMDAFNNRYLDYCGVSGNVPGYAQSSLLLGYERTAGADLLLSSEPFDWSGLDNLISLRRPDGTLSGPYRAEQVDEFTARVPPIDFTPDLSFGIEPPHLLFGQPFGVLISEISPAGSTTADITAVNYDDRLYADDDNFPSE